MFVKVFAAQTDPSIVNGLLYIALAAGAKDEALAAAEKYIAPTKDPLMMDTLAECYYVKGDRKNALRVEDEAIAKAKSTQLAANRARFDKGKGDAQEIVKLHADAAKLWKRLAHIEDEAAPDDEPGARPDAAAMAVYMTAHKVGMAVAKACAADAGTSESAYAPRSTRPAGQVEHALPRPNASPQLRTCVTTRLAARRFPSWRG